MGHILFWIHFTSLILFVPSGTKGHNNVLPQGPIFSWSLSLPHDSPFSFSSAIIVLASFFQVVSISVALWECCLWAFSGRVLAISVVGVWFRGQRCCNPYFYRVLRWKYNLARIFGISFSNIHLERIRLCHVPCNHSPELGAI